MRFGRASAVAAIVAAAVMIAGLPSASAEPGDLDATFGQCGVRPWSVPSAGFSQLVSTMVQPDGKILQVADNVDASLSVTRLMPSGAGIDRSYGSNGTRRVFVPGLEFAGGAVLAPDGRLVLVGYGSRQTHVVRLTAAGHRDQTFGTAGVLVINEFPPADFVVQADSRIIFVGGPGSPLERYNADGTRDATWSPELPAEAGPFVAATLATNGDLVVATTGPNPRFYRYKPDGLRELGFSASIVFPAPGAELTYLDPADVIALADGRFLVVGEVGIQYPGDVHLDRVGVVRLEATGAISVGYGTGGFESFGMQGTPYVFDARLDLQGRLLLSGPTFITENLAPLWLARVTPDGDHDPSFGISGTVVTGSGFLAGVTGIAVRGPWILVGVSRHASLTAPGQPSLYRFRTDATKLGAGYQLDRDAGLHPFRFGNDPPPPCVVDGPVLAGLARGVTTVKNRGGLVLDAFGGLHRFSIGARRAPAPPMGGPYWAGFDIARGVAALPNGKGGYVLDGYGGIHRYRTGSNPLPPPIVNGPYWPGWDIARGIALMPDGKSGYVVDGFGGIHRFSVAATPLPPPVNSGPPPGGDIVRGIAILADGSGGYLTNPVGAIWPFGIGGHSAPPQPGTGPPVWSNTQCVTPNGPCSAASRSAAGVTFVAPRVGS